MFHTNIQDQNVSILRENLIPIVTTNLKNMPHSPSLTITISPNADNLTLTYMEH